MMVPTVSVVVPTYNASQLLLETLASVFAQTFTDYEIIVINDGSKDDTAERLKPLSDAGKIRLINQSNGGIGVARNRGLNEARGKYIALLDHDDLWLPTKLDEQVKFMDARPAFAGCSVPWVTTQAPDRFVADVERITDASGEVKRPLLHLAHGEVFLISSALMVRREKIKGLYYAEVRTCIEDQPFQIALFARGPIGIAGKSALMTYRVHSHNYSSLSEYSYNGMKMLREMEQSGAFAAFKGQDLEDLRAYLAHQGRTTTVAQLTAGRRTRAAELYVQEIGHQFRDRRFKFLATAPVLGMLPAKMVTWIFGKSTR